LKNFKLLNSLIWKRRRKVLNSCPSQNGPVSKKHRGRLEMPRQLKRVIAILSLEPKCVGLEEEERGEEDDCDDMKGHGDCDANGEGKKSDRIEITDDDNVKCAICNL
jgi:hypothetical protein